MKKIHLLFVLLFCCLFATAKDTLNIEFPNKSRFTGERFIVNNDSTIVFKGTLRQLNFIKFTGFFENKICDLEPLYVKINNGANDTLFVNFHSGNNYYRENYSNNNYVIDQVSSHTQNENKFYRYKSYCNDTQRWMIYIISNDGDFIRGRSYDLEKNSLFDITDNRLKESFMWGLVFFGMVFISLSIFFLHFFIVCKRKMRIILFFFILILSLCSVFFIEKYIQLQLTLPFLSLCIVPFIMLIIKYKGKVFKTILNMAICFFIIVFWVYLQFYKIKDTAKLADGTTIELSWRRGTDLIKRHVVRRIIANMLPVPVSDHGKRYIVYVSKYEFTEGEFSILNDDVLGWVTYLLYNDPLDDFSFRETQVVIQMLKRLCGVNFDFLSYQEWRATSLGEQHSIHKHDRNDVDEGDVNQYGLVNVNSNVPEYTSNYKRTLRISLSTDTLINTYNYVFVAGSAYVNENSNDSINYSIVNKNFREGAVGFRLIYRPNNIGARNFIVVGRIDRNINNGKLPKIIKLVSLNGVYIRDLDNYESFEELLVESRFKEKTIEAIDLSNNKQISFIMPIGLGYYDFEPLFSFIGVDN